jgi:hypothetical protein
MSREFGTTRRLAESAAAEAAFGVDPGEAAEKLRRLTARLARMEEVRGLGTGAGAKGPARARRRPRGPALRGRSRTGPFARARAQIWVPPPGSLRGRAGLAEREVGTQAVTTKTANINQKRPPQPQLQPKPTLPAGC